MDCIFNELSAQPVATIEDACGTLAHFVNAWSAIQPFGMQRIRLPEDMGNGLYYLKLAPDYSVGSWLNDERVEFNIRERFRQIVANPPLISENEIETLSLFQRSEFCLTEAGGKPVARGFGVAWLSNQLLISLLTHEQWHTHALNGWHWWIEDDGQERTAALEVKHFSTETHVKHHIPWVQTIQQEHLKSSLEVWEKRYEFFPNLVLCGEVEGQLRKIGVSGFLNQIIERLRTLDAFAANWETGNFDLNAINQTTNLRISGESDSTMRLYSGRRRFQLPDKRRELFELHIKIGDLRFHFFPDNSEKKIYVGYIGSHLPTATG